MKQLALFLALLILTCMPVPANTGDGEAVKVNPANGAITSTAGVDNYAVNLNNQTFIFEGDSITHGDGITPPPSTATFAYLMSQSPWMKNHGAYLNVAVGGSRIGAGTGGGNNVTDRYAANVFPHRPTANGGTGGLRSYLFLMIGINEVSAAVPAATMISELSAYTTQARSDGFTVVLATVLPYFAQGSDNNRQVLNLAIRDGTIPKDILWDAARVLPDSNNTTYFQSDTLHPNTAGHALLFGSLLSTVYSHGSNPVPTPNTYDQPITVNGAGTSTFNHSVSVVGTGNGVTTSNFNYPAGDARVIRPEVSITFTPASTGWYRVLSENTGTGNGSCHIFDQFQQSQFTFGGWDNGSETHLNAIEVGSTDTGRCVTQVRYGAAGGVNAFDVNVTTSGHPIKVSFSGDQIGANPAWVVSSPTVGATALAASTSFNLSVANGLQTSGNVKAGMFNGNTVPMATDTVTLNNATQTLTNKSISLSQNNVLSTKSGFLAAGFSGVFCSGFERGWLAFSSDGLIFSQIHGLEKYNPPTITRSISANGASPDVFTSSVAIAKMFSGATQTVVITGMSNPALNGTFSVGSVIDSTHFTIAQVGTTTPVNGSGSAETGGTLTIETGLRDLDITKIGSLYFMVYDVSSTVTVNNIQNYNGVASSPDLVNWTHVSDVFANIASCKWFKDSDGTIGITDGTFFVPNTSGDGVTWGAPVQITSTDGSIPSGTAMDSHMAKLASTYYFFFNPTSDPGNYHVGTSSSKTSGYTDQGQITAWAGAGLEGLGLTQDSAGVWHMYAHAQSGGLSGACVTSTSPTLLPGSWSALVALPSAPTTQNFTPMLVLDNGGVYAFNDVDTFRDVASASLQNSNFFQSAPDSPFKLELTQPLAITAPLNLVKSGTGTISVAGGGALSTMTGTGTRFREELLPGTRLASTANPGAFFYVIKVNSDTSAQVFLGGGQTGTFTYIASGLAIGTDANNPSMIVGGFGDLQFFGNEQAIWYDSASGVSFAWDCDSNGYRARNMANGQHPYIIENSAADSGLDLAAFTVKIKTILTGSGAAPGIAVGAAAGTGATVTVIGDAMYGEITLTTGTSPTTGTLVTVTFSNVQSATHVEPFIEPENAAAAAIFGTTQWPFCPQAGQNGWTLVTNGAALAASTTYVIRYHGGGF